MHHLKTEENHDGRPLAMSADSCNRESMAERAQDHADAATEAAERTRREQRVLVEHLRKLETTAFGGPQQFESARVRAGLGPSRRQRRRQGMPDFKRTQKSGEDSKGDPPVGKSEAPDIERRVQTHRCRYI
ncbi:unnamed protein product [Peronospora farinosa]|uniref:Uncharacterized protein n=1 Tax=Peronospora farinosa TaxID=134698 RepID=A0AAV0U0S9_9STRA|nr:unnamed protein product [Peronospora farinosa]